MIWWLPYNEHANVCGTVVVIDHPNPLPTPTDTEPDTTLTPDPTSAPSPCVETTVGLMNGLRAHYEFDDVDDPGLDSTGNYGATVDGAVIEDDSERCGSVLHFSDDGASDTQDIMWLPDGVLHGVGDLTITFWIRVEGGTLPIYIISGHGPGPGNNPNATLYGYAGSGGGFFAMHNHGAATLWANAPMPVGGWQHMAVVRDVTNQERQLFVDGQEFIGPSWGSWSVNNNLTTLIPSSITPGALLVGQDQDCVAGCFGASQRLEGPLDDLRFYDRVLTADEIATLAGQ